MAISVTVDVILFAVENQVLHVLLIQRKNPPFADAWAFPGGFLDEGEDLEPAALRELQEETGLSLEDGELWQLGAYGTPGRDPRGHTITVAFFGVLPEDMPEVRGADDAAKAQWWPIESLPELAFDHGDILNEALAAVAGTDD
ncbi:NUDIX hydrolase [bacterium]|nr:NUDIX hydrolase [bacterium]